MAEQRERRTIHFAGHVQGVGFRYTTASIAQHHAITGFVRNLLDGRVQLVIEGDAAVLGEFLAELRRQMGSYIGSEATDVSPPTGEFDSFEVRH